MNNEKLTQTIEAVSKKYGFQTATADFKPFKDFKLRWERSFTQINFHISDYLNRAPENVISDLIEHVLKAIMRIRNDSAYPKSFRDYVRSEDFLRNKKKIFLRRTNLQEAPSSLVETVKEICDPGRAPEIYLSKTPVVSAVFDLIGVPENVFEEEMNGYLLELESMKNKLFPED